MFSVQWSLPFVLLVFTCLKTLVFLIAYFSFTCFFFFFIQMGNTAPASYVCAAWLNRATQNLCPVPQAVSFMK